MTGTAVLAPISGCLDESEPAGSEEDGSGGGDGSGDDDGTSGDDESEDDGGTDDGEDGTSDDDPGDDDQDGTTGREPIETDWPWGAYAEYDAVDLYAETPGGETLGGVRAALALTGDQQYLGLSDAEEMPEEGGMLFVFDSPGDLTFVMREMDFGLDIIFADADRTITTIHNAPEPGPDEDGNEQEYPGYGQYVLEVNYGWTDRNGVSEGDVLDFELPSEG